MTLQFNCLRVCWDYCGLHLYFSWCICWHQQCWWILRWAYFHFGFGIMQNLFLYGYGAIFNFLAIVGIAIVKGIIVFFMIFYLYFCKTEKLLAYLCDWPLQQGDLDFYALQTMYIIKILSGIMLCGVKVLNWVDYCTILCEMIRGINNFVLLCTH